ncbi:MAG TPA: hypothetical protein VJ810_26885 [Blastocatellia bacterium]|nr:hypothetical protein [Blastocatellia bacterium]
MGRQQYQPAIQNGPVAKRRTRAKNSATSKAFVSKKPLRRPHSYRLRRQPRDNAGGSSVIWMMILTGAALSAVFIFALRSQINTYKIAQAEEQLKTKLDEYASRQKFLTLDQQRALNSSESERAGSLNGLVQLRLGGEAAQPNAMANQIPPPVKALQTGHNPAKVVKVVKSNTAKRLRAPARVVKTRVVKVKKESNNRRQASRSLPRR